MKKNSLPFKGRVRVGRGKIPIGLGKLRDERK